MKMRKHARKTSERKGTEEKSQSSEEENTIGSPEDKESMVALVLSVPSFLFG